MQVTLAYLKRTTWFSSILSTRQPLSPKTRAPATMCLGCAVARSFPFRSEERDLFRRQPFRRIDTRRGGFAVDRFAGGGFLNDRSTKTKTSCALSRETPVSAGDGTSTTAIKGVQRSPCTSRSCVGKEHMTVRCGSMPNLLEANWTTFSP